MKLYTFVHFNVFERKNPSKDIVIKGFVNLDNNSNGFIRSWLDLQYWENNL